MMRTITKTLLTSIVTAVFLVGCSGFRDSVVGTYVFKNEAGDAMHCKFYRNGTLAAVVPKKWTGKTEATMPEHKWKIVGKEIWILDVDVALFGEKIRDVVFVKKENGGLILLSLDGELGKGKGRIENDVHTILEKLK